ncbi:hypothetical protein LLG95_12950 [bacterium]|nr:hypothetical protein [bacterium]
MSTELQDITATLKQIADEMDEVTAYKPGESHRQRYPRVGKWVEENRARIAKALRDAIAELKAATTIGNPEEFYRERPRRIPRVNDSNVTHDDICEDDE